MIVGRDMLNALGIAMDFAKKEITWDKAVVLMHSFPQIDEDDLPVAQQLLNEFLDEDYDDDNTEAIAAEVLDDKSLLKEEVHIVEGKQEENEGYKSKVIKESKYEATKLEDVCQGCTQLSLTQKNELYEVLSRYPTLFDGELQKCPHFKVHLELQQNAIPYVGKAYDIPYQHCKVFKKELDWLIQIGVLERALHSEWLGGTFIQPKQDTRVQWILTFMVLISI